MVVACYGYRTTSFSASLAAWNSMPFEAVYYEHGSIWDIGDATKFNIPTTGWYYISASHTSNQPSAAHRILKNGTTPIYQQGVVGKNMTGRYSNETSLFSMYLESGDYIEFQIDGICTSNTQVRSYPALSVVLRDEDTLEDCGVYVTRSTDFSLTVTFPTFDFDAEVYDTDAFWTAGTPGRVTIPAGKGGIYMCGFSGKIDYTVNAPYYFVIKKNGVTDVEWNGVKTPNNDFVLDAFFIDELAAGDYLEFTGYGPSGSKVYGGTIKAFARRVAIP